MNGNTSPSQTQSAAELLDLQKATSSILEVISRSTFDLQSVLDALAASAARFCGATLSALFLKEGNTLRARAFVGDFSQEAVELMRSTAIPIDTNTFMGRAFLEQTISNEPDFLSDGRPRFRIFQEILQFRAALHVPLIRDGNCLGVFALTRRSVGKFSEHEENLAKSIANQAVIAIQNTMLVQSLKLRTDELQNSLQELRSMQDRLVQTEKLASLGQLTAGIAHEIRNPLNFVNNFAEICRDLADEIAAGLKSEPDPRASAELVETSSLLRANLEKIVAHGRRADSIVKNMLAHSRDDRSDLQSVDLNAAVEEAIALAYQGARAAQADFNIALIRDYDPDVGFVDIYTQEFHRVLINVAQNGFYAATKRKEDRKESNFEPELRVSTKARGAFVEITVRDNGIGIPDAIRARLFEPFFTTKPAGEGTGLGLSISHDIIVKQHKGRIDVASIPGVYTEFSIVVPRTLNRSSGSA